MRWLVIYVSTEKKEHDYFTNRVLPRIKQQWNQATESIHIRFVYLYSNKEGKVIHGQTYQFDDHEPLPKMKLDTVRNITKTLVEKSAYDCLAYCGHSSGYFFGPDGYPHFLLKDLTQWLQKHEPVKLLVFDACYCGTLECLYEVRNVAKYIIAVPTYHDDSVLVATGLYQPNRDLKEYALSIVETFPDSGDPKMSLRLSLIDTKGILPMVEFVKKHWSTLQWPEHGIIHKSDPYLYHICSTMEQLPNRAVFETLLKGLVVTTRACHHCKLLYGQRDLCLGLYRAVPAECALTLEYYELK